MDKFFAVILLILVLLSFVNPWFLAMAVALICGVVIGAVGAAPEECE